MEMENNLTNKNIYLIGEYIDNKRKDCNKYRIIKFILKIVFLLSLIIINSKYKTFFKYRYLKSNFKYILENKVDYNHTHILNNTIFWCWFQGVEKAPKLYLSALNSLKLNLKNFTIILLNDNNFRNYVHFPPYIIEKYNNNLITKTHFSDILRAELLLEYGGTWIDASVLATSYSESFFDKDLFFFSERTFEAIGSSWFITSEKGSPIIRTTRDLLYEYWRLNNNLFDYFLFHMFFKISCFFYYKDFKNVPFISNRPPHQLRDVLNHDYSKKLYDKIINSSSIHKLSIKQLTADKKKGGTMYHHILEEYLPK